MKAVIYHSFDHALWDAREEMYENLCRGMLANFHTFNIPVIHLTTKGKPHFGDETIEYDLNPFNCMLNREIVFHDFLSKADDEVYFFTEPDARIVSEFPKLQGDISLLWRGKPGVEITPSFRIATKKALPFFELTLKKMDGKRPDWHGDSNAWGEAWREIGSPTGEGIHHWNGIRFEFRKYRDYSTHGAKYVRHYKHTSKVAIG